MSKLKGRNGSKKNARRLAFQGREAKRDAEKNRLAALAEAITAGEDAHDGQNAPGQTRV